MTVHITRLDEPGQTRVRVDGWLTELDLAELDRACAGRRERLVLDLEGLRDADGPALTRLRALASAGARLESGSLYLRLRLGGTDDGQGQPAGDGTEEETRSPDSGGDLSSHDA